jgi:hypothetical protein
MVNHDFERDRACYDQNFAQMRSLNEQMIKIPQVAVTITGGLWFVVGSNGELAKQVAFVFLFFGWVINFCLGVSCLRIRDVMQSYLERIQAFSEKNYASGKPEKPKLSSFSSYSMIKIYVFLMCLAGVLSLFMALEFYYPFGLECKYQQDLRTLLRISLYGLSGLVTLILMRNRSS